MRRIALATLALAGCQDTDVVVGGLHEVAIMRATPNRDLDLLFVIDNSPSMLDDQAALAANFPRMIDVLSELEGGIPNLHIGVVTPDMGTSGGPPIGNGGIGSCSATGEGGALRGLLVDVDDGAGGRTTNYQGALRDAFTSLAMVGGDGCGFEQPLAAMQAALADTTNGFVRPDANLAVVIVSDEDDCSANAGLFGPENPELGPQQSFRCFEFGVQCTPDDPRSVGPRTGCVPRSSQYMPSVQPFVDALVATKPDVRMIMTAVVAGPPDPVAVEQRVPPAGTSPMFALVPSCVRATADGPQTADPAVRLAAFANAFAPRSTIESLCADDFSTSLVAIGDTAKKLVGDPCIDTSDLADVDADTAGIQPACEVTDVRDDDSAPVRLPGCGGGSGDCFTLVPDPAACPRSAGHLKLTVQRATAASPDTWTHVRCQAASD